MSNEPRTKEEKEDIVSEANDIREFCQSSVGKSIINMLQVEQIMAERDLTKLDEHGVPVCTTIHLTGFYQGKKAGLRVLEEKIENILGKAKRMEVELSENK